MCTCVSFTICDDVRYFSWLDHTWYSSGFTDSLSFTSSGRRFKKSANIKATICNIMFKCVSYARELTYLAYGIGFSLILFICHGWGSRLKAKYGGAYPYSSTVHLSHMTDFTDEHYLLNSKFCWVCAQTLVGNCTLTCTCMSEYLLSQQIAASHTTP